MLNRTNQHRLDVHDESNDCTIVSCICDWCVSKAVKRDPCRAEKWSRPTCASPGTENPARHRMQRAEVSKSTSYSRVAFTLTAAIFCRNPNLRVAGDECPIVRWRFEYLGALQLVPKLFVGGGAPLLQPRQLPRAHLA
jgi:hypothetical protein